MPERNNEVKRYYADGSDTEAVRDGYAWLLRYATDEALRSTTIFISQVRNIPDLEEALGERASRLYRDRTLTERAVTVHVYTPRSFGQHGGPVLGVWVTDEDLLDRLDKWRIPAICAVGSADGIENWKARWRPIDIRTGDPAPDPGSPVSNPMVVNGLETLSHLANKANGIDTYNRNIAAQVFLALHRDGQRLDADEVRSWCARHGWGWRHAADLAELASRVNAGRQVRTGPPKLNENMVQDWRSEVEEDPPEPEDNARD